MIGFAILLTTIDLGKPIAIGPHASIAAFARAARECGISVEMDKMERVTVLLIGRKYSSQAITCTLKWKKRHRKKLQLLPFFGEPL